MGASQRGSFSYTPQARVCGMKLGHGRRKLSFVCYSSFLFLFLQYSGNIFYVALTGRRIKEQLFLYEVRFILAYTYSQVSDI